MLFIPQVLPLSDFLIALIDSAVLVAILFPSLYFLIFKPLVFSIEKRREAEKDLRKAYSEVELQVKERTENLNVANKKLEADIAERKKLGEEITASEERYRTLAEAARDPIFIIDNKFSIQYANIFAAKQFRTKPEEIIGKQLKELLPPQVYSHQKANLIKVFKEGQPVHATEKVGYPPDSEAWLDTILTPIKNKKGETIRVLGISRDISESKKTEKSLQASEQRFRDLVESTSDWVWEVDENAVYTYVSPKIQDILGYKPEEILGKTPFDLMPKKEAKRIADIFGRIAKAREPFSLLYNINMHKDGRLIVLETSGVPIISHEGTFKGYRGIDRDATERKRAKELSDALNDINNAISSTLNFEEIMQRVVTESVKSIRAEAAALDMIEDKHWLIKYIYNLPEELQGQRLSDSDAPFMAIAARTKKPVHVKDINKDTRVKKELLDKYHIRSLLAIPLIVRDKPIGVISYFYKSKAIAFTGNQIDFATKTSASVSLALENASLYSAEKNIADVLQGSLLTIPKKIEGINFGHIYRPATEIAKVGGDFFDLFNLEHNKVGIVVGDISGKGLEAATLVALVSNTIKAYAFEGESPSGVLEKTNEFVRKQLSKGSFITLFFGILNPKTGELVCANAGHSSPILRKKSGETSFLKEHGLPIGVSAEEQYAENKELLEQGDILVLYTDGLIEARREKQLFSDERLEQLLKKVKKPNVKELPDIALNEVLKFSKGKLDDDLVILTISLKKKEFDHVESSR